MLSLIIVVYQRKHDTKKRMQNPTFGYVFTNDTISINMEKLNVKCDLGSEKTYDYTNIKYVLHKGKKYIFIGLMNNDYVCMFKLLP